MRKITFILTFLTASLIVTFGQSGTDSISIKKVFGGYQFYQGENWLTINQLAAVMEPNEQAYKQIKSAQSTYTLATIIGAAGGFMVGWPMGTAIAGGEPKWALAGIGAGMIIVTIPIIHSFNKKAYNAVETYNNGLRKVSFWDKKELKLSVKGTEVGINLKF